MESSQSLEIPQYATSSEAAVDKRPSFSVKRAALVAALGGCAVVIFAMQDGRRAEATVTSGAGPVAMAGDAVQRVGTAADARDGYLPAQHRLQPATHGNVMTYEHD